MELRSSALQYEKSCDPAADINASPFSDDSFDVARLSAVSVERVRMWLAINGHSGPTVGYDLDMGGVDMTIGFDKVGAEYTCEKLGRSDWMLFGFYIDSILHRVSGDYNAVVGSGISGGTVRFDRL